MNKEQFYREDYSTFKPKYYLFCREKEYKTEKYSNILAQLKEKSYICRIIIKEIKDGSNI